MELRRAIVFVKNLQRMASFYGDTLGLKALPEGATGEWVEFEAGNVSFALHAIPDSIADAISISDPPRRRNETPIKLVFGVDNVAAQRRRLLEHGISMSEIHPWGGCDGIDPEGNVFQIVAK